MIAYIFDFQRTKFANISTCEFDHSEPGRKIDFRVYFHPVGYCTVLYLSFYILVFLKHNIGSELLANALTH